MAISSSKKGSKKEIVENVEIPNPVELKKEDEVVTLTKGELKDLAQNIKNDVLAEVNKEGATTPKSDNYLKEILNTLIDTNYSGGARELMAPISIDSIDVDDYLETPATFFSYSFTFTLFGDKRFNRDIKTPYNKPIRFKHTFRTTRKGTSRYDKTTLSLCTAHIYSKKELEWLRSHTLYGIKFYENIGDVEKVDVRLANKMVSVNNMLNSMTQHEVISKAKNEGISMIDNIDEVRKTLTVKMAQKELAAYKQRAKENTQSMMTPTELEEEVSNLSDKGTY